MTQHPIVRLQRTGDGKRIPSKKPHVPPKIPYDRQAQRLGKVFEGAAKALDDIKAGIAVSTDPRAVAPERCLVFEVTSPFVDFNVAAQALGLEWLASQEPGDDNSDEDEDSEDSEDGLSSGNDPAKAESKSLYLTMPSEQAVRSLLQQWKRYSSGESATYNFRELWKLFDYLKDLRLWSFKDRLDPAMSKYVDALLAIDPQRSILVEIDLWYRNEEERRDKSIATLSTLLAEVGGKMLDKVEIEEIRYQGVLIMVSAEVARQLVNGSNGIATLHDVMSIRPQSAFESASTNGPALHHAVVPVAREPAPAIAALLDGYPIEQHDTLAGRVRVVEVDVKAENVPVAGRQHGTAMASLILHGDLDDPQTAPLQRRIISIPVLQQSSDLGNEVTPEGKLPIGVIYNALNAVVNADSSRDSELANVVIINHSICDTYSPFVKRSSPWATLLDYFSHKHRLLFVISAGNITTSLPTEMPDLASFQAMTPDEQEAYLLLALESGHGARSILSPSESMNALTVGALHSDKSTSSSFDVDPFPNYEMVNLASAVGFGVNKSIKPDLVERGGRFVAGFSNGTNGLQIHAKRSVHYGQKVASPSSVGNTAHCVRTAGTSNAAALMTRNAHFVAAALEEVFRRERLDWRDQATRVPMLKALLIHGCTWGDIGDMLDKHYSPQGRGKVSVRRGKISKFLGFGRADISRVVSGNGNRITLLGDAKIRSRQMHEYILPIPPSLINNRELRSITITLSWTTPSNYRTADQRAVVLKLCDPQGRSSYWEGVGTNSKAQPPSARAARGTVIHVQHSGKSLQENANGKISLCVQAQSKSGYDLEEVPYAIAITIEVGQNVQSELYNEVSQFVQLRSQARASSNT
jgi:hypothetical protein